jgi:hypothetical protein
MAGVHHIASQACVQVSYSLSKDIQIHSNFPKKPPRDCRRKTKHAPRVMARFASPSPLIPNVFDMLHVTEVSGPRI